MNVLTKSLAILALLAWVGVARADDAAKKADKTDKAEKVADKTTDDAQKAADKKPGDKSAGAKGKGVRGTVVKVDGLALTVSAKGADGVMQETVVTTDDKTIVILDGKEGKLADLKHGQQVVVMAAESDKPARIQAKTPGKQVDKPKGEKPADKKSDDAK